MTLPDSGAAPIRVTALAVTAVKATRLRNVESVWLSAGGARGDRVFFLVDKRDRMINSKLRGSLQAVIADWDEPSGVLRLTFPDRDPVEAIIDGGAPLVARFYGETAVGESVGGPFEPALSAYLGEPVRLVRVVPNDTRISAVDRGLEGAVSLISRGSLARLASAGRVDGVDARRFRMLIEVDGVDPHAEDEWIGRSFQIGEARVQFLGNVGRCLITSRNPDTGEVTLATLDLLRGYRGEVETTEPLPFGIHGAVVEEGTVRVGDELLPQ